ncbi:MAG: hypothetical protein ACOYOB_09700 [Myxococcota bacterium]|jgi:recombination associated protein RdgC
MAETSRERYAFLGREFLTWLWYESAHNNSRVQTDTFGAVQVEFGQRLTLETGGNVREGSTVSADAPTETEEARTALRTGKKVSRARLILEVADKHYELGIDAETLTLSQLKLPVVSGGEDLWRIEERLKLLDEVEAIIDELYVAFVRLRRDEEAWGRVREAMREWVLEVPA